MEPTLRRRIHIAVVVAAGLVILLGMYALSAVFNPLLLALAMAYILNPVVRFLQRHKIPRKAAIGLLFFALFLVIAVTLVLIVPRIYNEAVHWSIEVAGEPFDDTNGNGRFDPDVDGWNPSTQDLNGNGTYDPGYGPRIAEWVKKTSVGKGAVSAFVRRFLKPDEAEDMLRDILASAKENVSAIFQTSGSVIASAWASGKRGMSWLWHMALLVILTPIYLAFLLNSLDKGWQIFVKYIPGRIRPRTLEILEQIGLVVSAFFRGRLLVCLAMGVFTAVGFALCGVPFGVLFGLVIGVLSFIPFLNVLGLLPTLLSCWMNGFGLWGYVAVIAVYGVGQGLDPLLSSLVLGKSLQLHPVTILLSVFVCSTLLGFFGMMLAIPLVATAKILAKEFLFPSLEALAHESPEMEDEATGPPPTGGTQSL